MSHDRSTMGTAPGVSPLHDTDPSGPPLVSGQRDEAPSEDTRRAMPFTTAIADGAAANLLANLAPARLPPTMGATPETDGHAAAAFVGPPRAPPRAHPTPAPQQAVIAPEPTVPPIALAPMPEPRAASSDPSWAESSALPERSAPPTTTVIVGPRRARARIALTMAALGVGAILATLLVLAVGVPARPQRAPSPLAAGTAPIEVARTAAISTASGRGSGPIPPPMASGASAPPTSLTASSASRAPAPFASPRASESAPMAVSRNVPTPTPTPPPKPSAAFPHSRPGVTKDDMPESLF